MAAEPIGVRRRLRIAVEGCAHGDLERIYASLAQAEAQCGGSKVDLLICCGDFQAVRNRSDLHCMAVPDRFKAMNTFHRYYSGELVAPVLTVFIGGNHEAANHLQELYYGGWAAPNIYFMGFSGVVRFGGLRIAGLSGIFKSGDYNRGYYEVPPYDRSSVRSIYHVRKFEEMKLAMLGRRRASRAELPRDPGAIADIFISHDWPRGIARHGNTAQLLRKKKYFRKEVEENTLGSPPGERLMMLLRPSFWFAAHLHVKFAALVRHPPVMQDFIAGGEGEGGGGEAAAAAEAEAEAEGGRGELDGPISGMPQLASIRDATQFLSLDKCMPHKHFLQLFEIAVPATAPLEERTAPLRLFYDHEWLNILKETQDGLAATSRIPQRRHPMLSSSSSGRLSSSAVPSSASGGNLAIPLNFARTAPVYDPKAAGRAPMPHQIGSPQTDEFVALLGLSHVVTIPWGSSRSAAGGGGPPLAAPVAAQSSSSGGGGGGGGAATVDPNAISLSDDDDDGGSTAGGAVAAMPMMMPPLPPFGTLPPRGAGAGALARPMMPALPPYGTLPPGGRGGTGMTMLMPSQVMLARGRQSGQMMMRAPPPGTMMPPLGMQAPPPIPPYGVLPPAQQQQQQQHQQQRRTQQDNRPAWMTQAEAGAAAPDSNAIDIDDM